jgi:endoglucanase
LQTHRVLLVVLALSLTMTAVGGTSCSSASTHHPATSTNQTSASTHVAAARFLSRYVTSDGRVIRHNQGADIVSEGQAYAMLIAEIAQQPALASTIWSWTSAHLGRPDGLFASRAAGSGQIEDPHSATDADILMAYALLRYAGPDQLVLHRAGQRVAEAVLAQEAITLPNGAPLPVAGPWAKSTTPPTVDPSYLMPGVFVAVARLTGDDRWNRAADAAIAMIGDLTDGGQLLPPDWAQLSGDRLVAIPNPGGGAAVQYGFDAARLPIWFATACSNSARDLAASWWRNVLGLDGRSGPQALGLTGTTINAVPSPLPLLAGAAAATSAGDQRAARELRARATTLALQDPTYYGDAWVALGPALLDRSITPCDENRP